MDVVVRPLLGTTRLRDRFSCRYCRYAGEGKFPRRICSPMTCCESGRVCRLKRLWRLGDFGGTRFGCGLERDERNERNERNENGPLKESL